MEIFKILVKRVLVLLQNFLGFITEIGQYMLLTFLSGDKVKKDMNKNWPNRLSAS